MSKTDLGRDLSDSFSLFSLFSLFSFFFEWCHFLAKKENKKERKKNLIETHEVLWALQCLANSFVMSFTQAFSDFLVHLLVIAGTLRVVVMRAKTKTECFLDNNVVAFISWSCWRIAFLD